VTIFAWAQEATIRLRLLILIVSLFLVQVFRRQNQKSKSMVVCPSIISTIAPDPVIPLIPLLVAAGGCLLWLLFS
jgi:hypothetical protein